MKVSPLVLVWCFCLATFVSGSNYYVNSVAANASDGGAGSSTTPWKTIAPLDSRAFTAGDTVFFARGSSYTGGFKVSSSGTAARPIVFAATGTGAAPSFSNTSRTIQNGEAIQVTGDYIVVDGLYFTACANGPNAGKDTDILKVGAVYGLTGADYLTVKNCEFNDCPIAVYVNGMHCIITKNYMHDSKRFLSDPDWGPIAIVIGNAYQEISYNTCKNYYALGGNYGSDGGFIETDSRYFGGPISHVNVHHNVSIANCGFMEMTDGSDSINIWYNLSDDYQSFLMWAGSTGRMDNNTIIRTRPPLVKDGWNIVFEWAGSSDVLMRNNIFVVANGVQVRPDFSVKVSSNNIYYCTDGSTSNPAGTTMGTNEKNVNPGFVDIAKGDYHLTSGSAAKDAGMNLGYTSDIEGHQVLQGSAPDIGAYEFGAVTLMRLNVPTTSSNYRKTTRKLQISGKIATSSGVMYNARGQAIFSGLRLGRSSAEHSDVLRCAMLPDNFAFQRGVLR